MALSEETIDKYGKEIKALIAHGALVMDEEWWVKFNDIYHRMTQEPGYEPPRL